MITRRKRASESFLASLPEMVDAILRLLPAKTLRITSCVNRLWFDISKRLLNERSRCVIKYYEKSFISTNEVDDLMDNTWVNPNVVILFNQRESWHLRRDRDTRRIEERHLARTLNILNRRIPKQCLLLGCTTERILLDQQLPIAGNRSILHKRQGNGLIILPEVEGVDYHHTYLRQPKPGRGQSWVEYFGVDASTPVKLVILTALSHSRDFIPHIAAGVRQTYGPRVAVLGAVAHDRIFFDGLVKRTRVIALFVSGNAFRACAKFVNNNRDSRFYERIEILATEAIEDGYESFFNMIITSRFISRGNAFYINSITAFNRPITEAPTFGLHSYGEFCLSSKDVGKTRPNACKRFMKYNTAIFCACSVKKERPAGFSTADSESRKT